MESIKSKQLYFHDLSKESFSSENYVRLNATSLEDIRPLLIKNIQDIFGVEVKFSLFSLNFGNVSNSHSAPLKQKTNWSQRKEDGPTSYLGWTGRVEGKMSKSYNETSFSDLFGCNGIKGFNTGSGGYGGDKEFGYCFCFFLDDFPILKKKYQVFQAFKGKFDREQHNKAEKKELWEKKTRERYESNDTVQQNEVKITELYAQIRVLQEENAKTKEKIYAEKPFSFKEKYTEDQLNELGKDFN
jgi:hypothetical protein